MTYVDILSYVSGEIVFTFRGIPITVSFWTLLLALILWWEAGKYIRRCVSFGSQTQYWLWGFAAMAGTFLTIVAHELAHAVTAFATGVGISAAGAHGFGMYVIPAKNFAEIAPIHALLISFAGPATNLLIAALLCGPLWMLNESMPENAIQYIAWVNWRLGKLNFLPIIVLDGGKIILSLLRMVMSFEWALTVSFLITLLTLHVLYKRSKRRRAENGNKPIDPFEPSDSFERVLEKL